MINENKKHNAQKKNKNYNAIYPKTAFISFFSVIMIGTALLMLPISCKSGSVGFLDALFTATSATCVTGLVVFDTFTKWTLFGQIVILCLIQIGGLGFMTIITIITHHLRRRMSLKEKLLLKESFGSIYPGDLKSLSKTVITGTIFFELLGAIILSTQFIPMMNFKNGLYTAVFLSVSAFCNAGFDVLGRIAPGSSLAEVNSNPVIILTISALIIIGGIGFIVWKDIMINKLNFKKYSLHSKITLCATAFLLLFGTVIYLVFESNNSFKDMPAWQTLMNAFFTSTTTRTAGFETVSTANLTDASTMMTYILMFIGGSSGSTAGGIKTSTFAILIICIISTIKNSPDAECFGRKIPNDLIKKATAIFFINFTTVFVFSIIISAIQGEFDYFDVLFECISAMGTVGMTRGITSSLAVIPKILIILLMFAGRLTSLIFVFAFKFNNANNSIKKPEGKMLVG